MNSYWADCKFSKRHVAVERHAAEPGPRSDNDGSNACSQTVVCYVKQVVTDVGGGRWDVEEVMDDLVIKDPHRCLKGGQNKMLNRLPNKPRKIWVPNGTTKKQLELDAIRAAKRANR